MAHIQDRRAQGRGWVARYRGPDGREHSKAFNRKVDAERWLTGQKYSKDRGEWIDPALAATSVEDYYQAWGARQPWRESSRASTESMFARHILPAFGSRALGSLRRGDVESWAAGLPLAGQTARVVLQKLSALLEAAAADGYIARNPARGAKRPRADAAPIEPFTADELDRLAASAPEWFRVALVLGAECGLRQGEAKGLTADRIDFLRRTLTVDRQLVTFTGEPAFAPPKTDRSYRTVPLASVTLDRLAAHIAAFGTGEYGLVLHEDERPLRRMTFGREWRRLRARAGLPEARFHDTRHTYAAVLLSGGVSVAATAEYMGHSPATLLKVYAHLIPADHDRARGVVQEAFTSSRGTDAGQQAASVEA